jgi:hypothetical protein
VEVVAEYDFNRHVDIPKEDLLGIEQQVSAKGIFTLDKMARHIKMIAGSRIIKFSSYKRSALYLKDEELRFIDNLIDDEIINDLLSSDGYNPCMREIFPSNLFRAELLKAIRYPEISYRNLHRRIFWSGTKTEPCLYRFVAE